eukprot:gene7516-9013_t
MTANALSLILTCVDHSGLYDDHSSTVLATNRDLSFKRLPAGWTRNSTISFKTQVSPFRVTSFTAPSMSKIIPTSSYTYSTLGQMPTWRPTTAPTIALSSKPTILLPTKDPSRRPTRSLTARPSREFTTAAPSVADSTGNGNTLPTTEAGNKQVGVTTEAIVIGVSAAGGAVAFGLIALLLCAACSYKLRKNREKYVERRKTLLPTQNVHTMTLEARRIETLKVLNEALRLGSTTATQDTTHPITTNSMEPIHVAPPPEKSPAQSADADSVSRSSFEMSSLHSSETSETDNCRKELAEAPHQEDSVRRLSEMEAQRVVSTDKPANARKYFAESDDSSIERGFNEILAEFSDESSCDSSQY